MINRIESEPYQVYVHFLLDIVDAILDVVLRLLDVLQSMIIDVAETLQLIPTCLTSTGP